MSIKCWIYAPSQLILLKDCEDILVREQKHTPCLPTELKERGIKNKVKGNTERTDKKMSSSYSALGCYSC